MLRSATLAAVAAAALSIGASTAGIMPETPASQPSEATGPLAAKAKSWIAGSWSVSMTEPGSDQPTDLTMAFDPSGALTITLPDDDPETGAWLVTAAMPEAAIILLDEDALDADPSDDVYLDITMTGPDSGEATIRPPEGADGIKASFKRGPAATTPAGGGTAVSGPIALAEQEPASVAGVIDAVKAFGMMNDARFGVAAIDLNGDGTDEALVKITQMYWCSGNMEKCRIWILQRNGSGSWDSLGYPYAVAVELLESSTNGYRDLAFDGMPYAKAEYGNYAAKE